MLICWKEFFPDSQRRLRMLIRCLPDIDLETIFTSVAAAGHEARKVSNSNVSASILVDLFQPSTRDAPQQLRGLRPLYSEHCRLVRDIFRFDFGVTVLLQPHPVLFSISGIVDDQIPCRFCSEDREVVHYSPAWIAEE